MLRSSRRRKESSTPCTMLGSEIRRVRFTTSEGEKCCVTAYPGRTQAGPELEMLASRRMTLTATSTKTVGTRSHREDRPTELARWLREAPASPRAVGLVVVVGYMSSYSQTPSGPSLPARCYYCYPVSTSSFVPLPSPPRAGRPGKSGTWYTYGFTGCSPRSPSHA